MEWLGAYAAVNIQEVIRELLAVKASNEELTRRVERLEQEVQTLAGRERNRYSVRYVRGKDS